MVKTLVVPAAPRTNLLQARTNDKSGSVDASARVSDPETGALQIKAAKQVSRISAKTGCCVVRKLRT